MPGGIYISWDQQPPLDVMREVSHFSAHARVRRLFGGRNKKGAGKLASASPNPISGKRYDLSLRSSGTANPRHSSVREPGSGTVVLPAVMIRAKSPGSEKLLFRNA